MFQFSLLTAQVYFVVSQGIQNMNTSVRNDSMIDCFYCSVNCSEQMSGPARSSSWLYHQLQLERLLKGYLYSSCSRCGRPFCLVTNRASAAVSHHLHFTQKSIDRHTIIHKRVNTGNNQTLWTFGAKPNISPRCVQRSGIIEMNCRN